MCGVSSLPGRTKRSWKEQKIARTFLQPSKTYQAASLQSAESTGEISTLRAVAPQRSPVKHIKEYK